MFYYSRVIDLNSDTTTEWRLLMDKLSILFWQQFPITKSSMNFKVEKRQLKRSQRHSSLKNQQMLRSDHKKLVRTFKNGAGLVGMLSLCKANLISSIELYWFPSLTYHTVINQSIITFKLLPLSNSWDDIAETRKLLHKSSFVTFKPLVAILQHLINLYKKLSTIQESSL